MDHWTVEHLYIEHTWHTLYYPSGPNKSFNSLLHTKHLQITWYITLCFLLTYLWHRQLTSTFSCVNVLCLNKRVFFEQGDYTNLKMNRFIVLHICTVNLVGRINFKFCLLTWNWHYAHIHLAPPERSGMYLGTISSNLLCFARWSLHCWNFFYTSKQIGTKRPRLGRGKWSNLDQKGEIEYHIRERMLF